MTENNSFLADVHLLPSGRSIWLWWWWPGEASGIWWGSQGQKSDPSWKVLPENSWRPQAMFSDEAKGKRASVGFKFFNSEN